MYGCLCHHRHHYFTIGVSCPAGGSTSLFRAQQACFQILRLLWLISCYNITNLTIPIIKAKVIILKFLISMFVISTSNFNISTFFKCIRKNTKIQNKFKQVNKVVM